MSQYTEQEIAMARALLRQEFNEAGREAFDRGGADRPIVITVDSAINSICAALRTASQRDRDAYEGAREDLLDWKRRAQRAEAELRRLGYVGIDVSEPPATPASASEAIRVGHLHSNGEFCSDYSIQSETWPVPLYLRHAPASGEGQQ